MSYEIVRNIELNEDNTSVKFEWHSNNDTAPFHWSKEFPINASLINTIVEGSIQLIRQNDEDAIFRHYIRNGSPQISYGAIAVVMKAEGFNGTSDDQSGWSDFLLDTLENMYDLETNVASAIRSMK